MLKKIYASLIPNVAINAFQIWKQKPFLQANGLLREHLTYQA